MQVDVIIAAYERAELLIEAAQSVLTQTHTDLNLIIVDDASPQPLAERVLIADRRMRFVRLEKNRGPGGARNAGVSAGRAPLVAFLDSDDLWRETKLEKQVRQFSAEPSLQWTHSNEEWQRHGVVVTQRAEHRKQGGSFLERAFGRCLIANSAVVFRRGFYEKHRGFNAHFPVCSDFELWLRMLADAPIGFLEETLVVKRAGDWPQVSSTPETDRYRVLALHRFYRDRRKAGLALSAAEALLDEAIYKCQILVKGAQKYQRPEAARRYQAWLTLLTARRTRPIR
ncbi:glycosyltransferase family 2 protein [Turneriella parva]|uniref:Glycosyl transferase family 2 n=1 Tax=Turneriella parva (strain ATCC BAA-1111 / DSM 21527 / NCTC 11395 / H) TaxID=869212 RepID=I4B455_TURPD|nr:glycosyltransferase family A protein [Turneriella parva]AFM12062.1 glycosyl transferase family 2 [Turneriella parva DSM 21527]